MAVSVLSPHECMFQAHLAIPHSGQAMGPTVAVVPVKASPQGVILIRAAWVGIVANETVDIGLVGSKPLAIHRTNVGSSKDVITVVEVVVVVVSVSKVRTGLSGDIGCR